MNRANGQMNGWLTNGRMKERVPCFVHYGHVTVRAAIGRL